MLCHFCCTCHDHYFIQFRLATHLNCEEWGLSPTERTVIVIQLCLRSRLGLWKNITMRSLISHTSFFQCGVYKYCWSGYETVWCQDEIRGANYARTMEVWGSEI